MGSPFVFYISYDARTSKASEANGSGSNTGHAMPGKGPKVDQSSSRDACGSARAGRGGILPAIWHNAATNNHAWRLRSSGQARKTVHRQPAFRRKRWKALKSGTADNPTKRVLPVVASCHVNCCTTAS